MGFRTFHHFVNRKLKLRNILRANFDTVLLGIISIFKRKAAVLHQGAQFINRQFVFSVDRRVTCLAGEHLSANFSGLRRKMRRLERPVVDGRKPSKVVSHEVN